MFPSAQLALETVSHLTSRGQFVFIISFASVALPFVCVLAVVVHRSCRERRNLRIIASASGHKPRDHIPTGEPVYPGGLPVNGKPRFQSAAPSPTPTCLPPIHTVSPKFTPTLPSFQASDNQLEDVCPICLAGLREEPISAGECLHAVHTLCYRHWLAHLPEPACPVCRAPVFGRVWHQETNTGASAFIEGWDEGGRTVNVYLHDGK